MLNQMTTNNLQLDDIRCYISQSAEKEKQAKELKNGHEGNDAVSINKKNSNKNKKSIHQKSINHSNSAKSSTIERNVSNSMSSNPDILKKSKTS